MITMDMIGKVRRMRMREKLSISEIAKTTRLSRNTIKKWLKEPGDVSPKYRRSSAPGKLTAYMPTLEQCLKTDAHRPKHARRNGRALFSPTRIRVRSTKYQPTSLPDAALLLHQRFMRRGSRAARWSN